VRGDLAEIRCGVVDQHDEQPEKGTRPQQRRDQEGAQSSGNGLGDNRFEKSAADPSQGYDEAATVTTNNSSCEASDFAGRSYNGGMTLSSCGSGTAVATAR